MNDNPPARFTGKSDKHCNAIENQRIILYIFRRLQTFLARKSKQSVCKSLVKCRNICVFKCIRAYRSPGANFGQCLQKIINANRFLNKISNPYASALFNQTVITHRTNHDNTNIGINLSQLSGAFNAVSIRQIHIHSNSCGAITFKHLNCFRCSTGCSHHFKIRLCQ